MKKKTEYDEEEKLIPSPFVCGSGSDVNCEYYYGADGCGCNAEHFGDENCQAPCNIEEDNDL